MVSKVDPIWDVLQVLFFSWQTLLVANLGRKKNLQGRVLGAYRQEAHWETHALHQSGWHRSGNKQRLISICNLNVVATQRNCIPCKSLCPCRCHGHFSCARSSHLRTMRGENRSLEDVRVFQARQRDGFSISSEDVIAYTPYKEGAHSNGAISVLRPGQKSPFLGETEAMWRRTLPE